MPIPVGDLTTVPSVHADLGGVFQCPRRGTQASLQSVLPLMLGEFYFATDTGNLFFGTPGIGLGYIQIGDTTGMNETLIKLQMELRAIRLALVHIACEGGRATPPDFDPQNLSSDAEVAVDAL
jgi:hypothetical protein